MKKIIERAKSSAVFMWISELTLGLFIIAIGIFALYGFTIPSTVSCFAGEEIPSYFGASFEAQDSRASVDNVSGVVNVTRGQYKLFGAIPVRSVTLTRLEDVKVYVGGVPFGLKYTTKGASVAGFEEEAMNPAFRAGLRLHDVITKVNGKTINGASDIAKAVESGSEIELTYVRAGKEFKLKFKPKYSESEKKYVLGLWLRDSGAGIGTLTYILPDGSFGGLGHGVCEGETSELVSMSSGNVLGATINGLIKGQRGAPGELQGYFNSSNIGEITKNSDVGIFGTLSQIPEVVTSKTYSIGLKNELKEGKATIICTLDDNVRREYSVEIFNINLNSNGNKCFSVRITDDKLLAASGGIIQGMSGSPIIQNGKLVGAITHVLINDPTQGYGIFIENMLSQMAGDDRKAA